MISYLRGRLLDQSPEGRITVGVGATDSCVGYSLAVPSIWIGSKAVGADVEFFVHTHVREDAFELFGFPTRLEREVFLTLLSVNGIGPKGGMGIISSVSVADLIAAILEGDSARLTKIPGVGKKTAERMVLELADPVRKRVESGLWSEGVIGTATSKRITAGKTSSSATASAAFAAVGVFREAKDALVALGYRENEVVQSLERWRDRQPEVAAEPTVERILKDLLKEGVR